MLHRTRHLLIRQQTAVINAIRAHPAEFGIVAPLGRLGVEELLGVPIRKTNGYPTLHERVWRRSVPSRGSSRSRF
jgi:transposase